MTIAGALSYLDRFRANAGDVLHRVDVVLCPPYTALYPMAQYIRAAPMPLDLGAQTVSAAAGGAHTGEISARLAFEAGARWALVGHWEQRRHLGDTDEIVNQKLHRALEAGLRPLLLVGERRGVPRTDAPAAVREQLDRLFVGCDAAQASAAVVIYEPEWTIGAREPAPVAHVAAGAAEIRAWLGRQFGPAVAAAARVVYGGSVTPAHAAALLAVDDLDGLGAGRKGRDADAFARIVDMIASN